MKYCDEYAALLDLYVDGELTAEEMDRVQAHLETCPGCQAYVDGVFAMRAAFPSVDEVEVPEHFCEDVMERVRALPQKMGRRTGVGRRWAQVLVPLAACCAVVVLLKSAPWAGTSGRSMNGSSVTASGGGTEMGSTAGVAASASQDEPEADMECVPAEAYMEEEAGTAGHAAGDEGAVFGYTQDRKNTRDMAKEGLSAPSGMPALGETAPEAVMDNLEGTGVVLTLTAEEAGTLLDSFSPIEERNDSRLYKLTWEEYTLLRQELAIDEDFAGAAGETVLVEVREDR